ncbi:MAG TPA: hypothetical protein VN811_12250 [Thermoanaerobaculia bacterium]|nr:hypothetical protein [Thermoanaerobaculia bacterium]HXT51809.1 hypothetical protein [Thermoanaerobaculia bacterium]
MAVFVVRTLLNYLFYGVLTHAQMEEMAAAHPGMFREVVPAFIALDLVAAIFITFLVVKAAASFGGGIKAGVTVGILIAILSPVLCDLYQFFSVTYFPAGAVAVDSIFQLVSHAIQGAVAAAIYKTA